MKKLFDPPVIYGQFTDWNPVKMFDVRDFCDKLCQTDIDILQLCKDKNLI